jgi:hypothetical protein
MTLKPVTVVSAGFFLDKYLFGLFFFWVRKKGARFDMVIWISKDFDSLFSMEI